MGTKARIAGHVMLVGVFVSAVGCPPRVPMLRLLYNQGTYGESGGYSELEYSDFFGGGSQIGDDFELGVRGSTITHVRWWGAYRDNIAGPDDFTILIYTDRGDGMPEPWSYCEYRTDTATRTATGELFAPGGWALDIYEYSTDIPSWALNTDTPYYIVILNNTGRWLWCDNDSPLQGNDFGVFREGFSDDWGGHGIDMAFQLWSDE